MIVPSRLPGVPRLLGIPRLPRRTVRLRLTLLYGGLFLISGTALLVITYVLVAHRFPTLVTTRGGAATGVQTGPAGGFFPKTTTPACLPGPTPRAGQLFQCAAQAQGAIARQQAQEMNQLLIQSGVALAIMSVISIGLGWLVAGRVLRPLRTITAAARRVSASSLHERLALAGPDDELKELGDTFDGLLGRLEASFDAQRQFVANASHELRTPLARQRAVLEVALADPEVTAGSLSAACTRALAAGEQQERLIEALLTLARSQRGLDRRAPVELAAIVGGVVKGRLPQAASSGIRVSTALGAGAILGDARLAERLAANLVDNALRHNVPGGWVRVITHSRAGHTVLCVASSGPVIAPEDVDGLFEPFRRLGADRTASGASREGLGLGLSIVRAIADAHHARLRARALPAGGLDVQIRFPRPGPAAHPLAAPAGAASCGQASRRIRPTSAPNRNPTTCAR